MLTLKSTQKAIEDAIPNVDCRKEVLDKVKLIRELEGKVRGNSFLIIRYQDKKAQRSIINFQNYKAIASWARDIYEGNITLREAKWKQSI